MTADEMFKKLGYERDYPMESTGTIRYQKKFGEHIVLYIDSGEISKENDSFWEQSWNANEIRAVAKLLDELEADHEQTD